MRRQAASLLFYARPKEHAERNMFELGLMAIAGAIDDGILPSGWRYYGVGAMEPSTVRITGTASMEVLPRQSQDEYRSLLREHSVGLSLMDTPHPSLVPLEMASAGMLVVTSTFENKTYDALRAIPGNLIPVEPTVDAIKGGLSDAVAGIEDCRSPHPWLSASTGAAAGRSPSTMRSPSGSSPSWRRRDQASCDPGPASSRFPLGRQGQRAVARGHVPCGHGADRVPERRGQRRRGGGHARRDAVAGHPRPDGHPLVGHRADPGGHERLDPPDSGFARGSATAATFRRAGRDRAGPRRRRHRRAAHGNGGATSSNGGNGHRTWHPKGGPVIAIAMTTHRPADRVFQEADRSIREQTHENWVCVISDDASRREAPRGDA